jgi:hypothetical protein
MPLCICNNRERDRELLAAGLGRAGMSLAAKGVTYLAAVFVDMV